MTLGYLPACNIEHIFIYFVNLYLQLSGKTHIICIIVAMQLFFNAELSSYMIIFFLVCFL